MCLWGGGGGLSVYSNWLQWVGVGKVGGGGTVGGYGWWL